MFNRYDYETDEILKYKKLWQYVIWMFVKDCDEVDKLPKFQKKKVKTSLILKSKMIKYICYNIDYDYRRVDKFIKKKLY